MKASASRQTERFESQRIDPRTESDEMGIETQLPNERDRTRSAAVTLAIFWGLALVCMMIPYVNLVVTPLLFIMGPFAAWKASQRTKSAYITGTGARQGPKSRE